ncbi:MAG: ABC transporter ATP-binding protein [Tepidisphaeraceae bacterium]|jgi:ABC-type polysaccharide/polyol phosphate transport system ATPase subunit
MSESPIVISAANLSKRFKIYPRPLGRLKEWLTLNRVRRHDDFWALRDVSLAVRRGECLGIVGENGSGKSTLLKILTSTLSPTSGTYSVNGRVLALLELSTGLNRELTGSENIRLSAQLLGIEPSYIESRYSDIAEFAGLGEFLDRPIKLYSSGMMVRLAFSLFAFLEPDVLIIDEALAVGDAAFQRKCYRRMEEMICNENRAVILVTHDTQAITKFCTTAAWMDHGKVRLAGEPAEVVEEYLKHALSQHAPASAVVQIAPSPRGGSAVPDIPRQGLLPRCEAAILYPSAGVEMLGAWLEDAQGNVVGFAGADEPITIAYAVRMSQPIEGLVFGIRLTTIRGDWVFGTNTNRHNVTTPSYAAQDVQIVRWPLRSGLGIGEYFLSCGCSIGDDAHRFVLREVDAYQLSVRGVSANSGLCSLVQTPVLSAVQ